MRISYAPCAILAPALASAAAFAMPESTHHFAPAADNWSPAPTAAPQFNLFGRDNQQATDNTCGYVSGLSVSSVTCPNSKPICATNTFFGVHGCCESSDLSSCTIATTCIPSSAMSASCTDSVCSSDNAIAKCTDSTAMECYEWLFAYESTVMTQHGCTSSGFTSTAQRTYGATPSAVVVTVTATPSPATTPTSTSTSSAGGEGGKKQSFGPIIGGTVGGCIIISLVALTAFLIHRRRQKKKTITQPPPTSQFHHHHHNSPDFSPAGFQTGWTEQDIKTWQQSGGVHRPGGLYTRVSEVHGQDRAVEVEAPEKSKGAGWQQAGHGAVEVEAPVRNEKRGSWRGAVEAPT